MTAIRGHERETLKKALDDACKATQDPAALAEILSETLRGLGVVIQTHDVHGVDIYPDSGLIAIGVPFKPIFRLELSAVRALLLRLLQLPEGSMAADALREVEAR